MVENSTNTSNIKEYTLFGLSITSIVGGLYLGYETIKKLNTDSNDNSDEIKNSITNLNKDWEFSEKSSIMLSESSFYSKNKYDKKNEILLEKIIAYIGLNKTNLLNKKLDFIEEKCISYESSSDNIKENININSFYSKKTLISVVSIVKELSDYIYSIRNADYIKERRENKNKNNYVQICNNYIKIYSYCLTLSKNYIFRKLKLSKSQFKLSIENFSQSEDFYSKMNYYSDIFGNYISIKNSYKCNQILELSNLINIFENYCSKLVNGMAEIELWMRMNENMNEEELGNKYSEKLNFLKLNLSDEMFNNYFFTEDYLKYELFTLNTELMLKNFNNKIEHLYSLLEKVNGIELISLGFS